MIKKKMLFGVLILLAACDEPIVVKVTGVSILPASLSIAIDETSQLGVTVSPVNASNKEVKWSSSNESVATVDASGMVTALSAGEAVITVTTEDGDHTATCDVTVSSNQLAHGGETWSLFNAQTFTVVTNNATTLQFDLAQNALWYNASQGGLAYRLVSGDFEFTATVNAVKRTNNGQSATCSVCLGGLMVRNPASTIADEDYVHLVTGVTPGGLGAETKNTTNSASQYLPTAASQPPHTDGYALHDLKIVRDGNTFTLYKKSAGDADWVELASYDRPDLPNEVAIGMNIYTSVGGPTPADLSVIYQDITLIQ